MISNSNSQHKEQDQTLLPEFEEIIEDFNMSTYITLDKDREPLYAFNSRFDHMRREDYEEEIKTLNNRVEFLQERVCTLETELLNYYGFKDQESTITELRNRVKINNTEAKLFNLKIEALQVENKKIKAQVVDYSKVVSELEAAKETIDFLKKKLKAESEQNTKQLLSLQERVRKMQDQEFKAVSGNKSVELKLNRFRELEEDVEELRNCNRSLRNENLELAQKLEQAQIQENNKIEELKGETENLKRQNEELSKQLEQLQSSWCTDLEELVYLRWVNACLRYEVRNYQPEPGKTISRDLSRTLSPKSEEKAKQLILEYANKQGLSEKGRYVTDSDFDQWSFSQFSNSNHSDNGEFDDDSSLDNSRKSDASSKRRILGKLRNLLRGEDENDHNSRHGFSGYSMNFSGKNEDEMRRLSISSEGHLKGIKTEERKELEHRRRNSDIGLPQIYKSLGFGRGSDDVAQNQIEETLGMAEERFRMAKYAEVFKDSTGVKLHRRAVSHT